MNRKTRMYRWVSVLLATMMLVTTMVFAASYETETAEATGKGIVTQDLQSDNNLTRGELVALINSFFEYKELGELKFSDVNAQSPYYQEIAKAFKAGYIVGRGDNTFDPEGEVNRVEAYIMISRALKLDVNQKPEQLQRFADAKDIPAWGLGAVEAMTRGGWINDKNKVKPYEKLLGSEASALLEKATGKTVSVQSEAPKGQAETKGNGQAALNFTGAFFAAISEGKSADIAKLEDGSSDSEIIIKLVFDRGVVRENWENNKKQIRLQSNNGSIIESEVFRIEGSDGEKSNIFIKPLVGLKSGKTINIVIGKDLMANNGNTLGEEVILSFTVK